MLAACGTGVEATPIATESMSSAQLQAFEEATQAAVAYMQTVADLYTGERDSLDDLAAVTVDPELDTARRSIAQARAQGHRSEPVGARVELVSAEPYSVQLDGSPPSVELKACLDATALTSVSPAGDRRSGTRERVGFRVVFVDSSPTPHWAVSEVSGGSTIRERAC